jgi:hypothetical protein
MSVSLPGTIVIFTQMSGFAVLNAFTMSASASESGGVWLVQNLTSVAPDWHDAPVTGDAWALPEGDAAADGDSGALALALAPALAAPPIDAPALAGVFVPLQAATVMATTASNDHGDRRADRFIAPPRSPARAIRGLD